jgi:tetratricopeptide (TPR) repeat protein
MAPREAVSRIVKMRSLVTIFAIGHFAASIVLAQINNPAAEAERASRLLVNGKPEEAIPIYRRLVRTYPKNPDLLLNLCIAEFESKHFDNASAHARAALELKPDLAPANLFLGSSEMALGHEANAIEPLEKAVAAMPGDANAAILLAEALEKTQRYTEALKYFQRGAELLPNNPRVWYGLGRTYEALAAQTGSNSYRSLAAQAYDRLLQLPPSLQSYLYTATRLDSEGRYREAAAAWRNALQLAPSDINVQTGLVWALYRSHDYDSILPVLTGILKEKPDSAEASFLYGATLLNLSQPKTAVPYLKTALQHDPNLMPAKAALGQALLQEGNPQQAIPYLEAALPGDEDGNVHFQLFRAYQLTGDSRSAHQAFLAYQHFRASLEQKQKIKDGSQ